MINRNINTTNHVFFSSTWASKVASLIAQNAEAFLKLHSSAYDAATRTVNFTVGCGAFNALPNNYKVVIALTEDSIVACQLDIDANPQQVNNYVNRHILRATINTTWGDDVASQPDAVTKYIKLYSYTLPTTVVPEQCHLVAYVYDATDRKSVV